MNTACNLLNVYSLKLKTAGIKRSHFRIWYQLSRALYVRVRIPPRDGNFKRNMITANTCVGSRYALCTLAWPLKLIITKLVVLFWATFRWWRYITQTLRSTREGNVFTGVCPSTRGEGPGLWSHVPLGGYPQSLVPGPFWEVPLDRTGVPPDTIGVPPWPGLGYSPTPPAVHLLRLQGRTFLFTYCHIFKSIKVSAINKFNKFK